MTLEPGEARGACVKDAQQHEHGHQARGNRGAKERLLRKSQAGAFIGLENTSRGSIGRQGSLSHG